MYLKCIYRSLPLQSSWSLMKPWTAYQSDPRRHTSTYYIHHAPAHTSNIHLQRRLARQPALALGQTATSVSVFALYLWSTELCTRMKPKGPRPSGGLARSGPGSSSPRSAPPSESRRLIFFVVRPSFARVLIARSRSQRRFSYLACPPSCSARDAAPPRHRLSTQYS